MLRIPVQAIAETPDRGDENRFGGVGLNPPPEPFDMNIQSFRVAFVIGPPQALQDLAAGEHAAGVTQKQLQELELPQRHGDHLAVDPDLVALDVHPHPAGGQHRLGFRGGGAATAQDRLEARQELPVGVGLGDVVAPRSPGR